MLGTAVITYLDAKGRGPYCQLRPKRPTRTKRIIGQDEENWLNLKPKFEAPVEPELKTPFGTAKPFVPESFARREAEYAFLVATQNLELPSLAQEFAANGLSAMSLSSSPQGEDDDDMEAANLAEHHLGFVPYDPDPETLAALTRRIDWEKFFVYSQRGQAKVYAAQTQDGGRTLRCTNRTWTKEDLAKYAPKMRELIGERSIKDIENARARATFYRRLVWSLMSPSEQDAWHARSPEVRAYLEPADEVDRSDWDLAPLAEDGFRLPDTVLVPDPDEEGALVTDRTPDPITGGPEDLGLHTLSEDFQVELASAWT